MSNFAISLLALTTLLGVGGQLTGCESTDYDGKQVLEQIHCKEKGGEMKSVNTGILWQQTYTCIYPESTPIEFLGANNNGY